MSKLILRRPGKIVDDYFETAKPCIGGVDGKLGHSCFHRSQQFEVEIGHMLQFCFPTFISYFCL